MSSRRRRRPGGHAGLPQAHGHSVAERAGKDAVDLQQLGVESILSTWYERRIARHLGHLDEVSEQPAARWSA